MNPTKIQNSNLNCFAGVATPCAIAQLFNILLGIYGEPRQDDDTADDSPDRGRLTIYERFQRNI